MRATILSRLASLELSREPWPKFVTAVCDKGTEKYKVTGSYTGTFDTRVEAEAALKDFSVVWITVRPLED